MIAVAKIDGDQPGVFVSLHTALYDTRNQPKEDDGPSDLPNAELAKLAELVGASDATQKAISDGIEAAAGKTDALSNLDLLTTAAAKVGRAPAVPTVAKGGVPVDTNPTGWLTKLLPHADSSSTEGPASTTIN